jgi:hypothetical protein
MVAVPVKAERIDDMVKIWEDSGYHREQILEFGEISAGQPVRKQFEAFLQA